MPLPLPMAPTVHTLPPSSNWMAYSLFMGVGGHDGGGSVRAALRGGSQLFRCRRDAPGKGVDDHGLTDDAGGGGQNVLCVHVQRLAYQCTALLGQRHAVGGAGVGVAAVYHNGLCIAIGQMGAVHLDGRTADLVGGVHARSSAAHLGLDERQIVIFRCDLPGCRNGHRRRQSPWARRCRPQLPYTA